MTCEGQFFFYKDRICFVCSTVYLHIFYSGLKWTYPSWLSLSQHSELVETSVCCVWGHAPAQCINKQQRYLALSIPNQDSHWSLSGTYLTWTNWLSVHEGMIKKMSPLPQILPQIVFTIQIWIYYISYSFASLYFSRLTLLYCHQLHQASTNS